MRKNYLSIYLLLFSLLSWSQSPQFTWMSGYMLGNQPSLYSPKGVTTATCMPGPRTRSVSWTDNNGNLWMFGGTGNDAANIFGIVSDLWKYDISTNMWTWLKGDSVVGKYNSYGTQGVSSNANKPAFRDRSVSWTHKNGDLYMFGGLGRDNAHNTGTLNDLWKYNISLNQWTWVGGSNLRNQPGVYGTKGVSSSSNYPGSRMESTTWVDTAGNFWLFGGYGYGIISGDVYLNDLWKRNPVNGRWTWVSGSSSASPVSRYGTKGVASPFNTPGARSNGVSWIDADGNIWLFGGKGHTSSGFGFLNDVWKFDIASNQWTWITGDTILNKTGKYGLSGVPSTTNTPGCRDGALGWSANNTFYLNGGYGYDSSTDGALNDFWKFDAVTFEWTWLGGSNTVNQPGSFGTKTVFSYANVPRPRYQTINWKDNNGIFWMFGGNSSPFYGPSGANGDLWKIDLCSSPVAPTSTTGNSDLVVCQGNSTVLSATGTGILKWYANPSGGALLSTGSTYTTAPLTTNTTYYVQDSTCDKGVRTAITITVNPAPTLTVSSGTICTGQSFTINAGGALSYTYSAGPVVMPAASASYTITGDGSNGCIATAISSVTVHSLPVISAPAASICSGQSYTFFPTGANTYTYSGGTATITPTTSANYTISGTDLHGCQNSTSSFITVNSLPVITVNNATICSGQTFTIVPNGGDLYSYSGGTDIVNPNTNITYTVTGTNSLTSCSNTAISSVIVNPTPTITVNSGSICVGDSFTIVPSGANSYNYSSGSDIVLPTVTTIYTITGTSSDGCVSASAISSVSVNPLPTLAVNSGTICSGNSFTIAPSGANTYSYSGGNNIVNPPTNTTYTITGTDINGCENTITSDVTVNPLPTITVNSGSVCAGNSFTIIPSGASTYSYSGGSSVVSPAVDATYTVTGAGLNGCISNDAVSSVTVNSLPIITVNSGTICSGNFFTIVPGGGDSYIYSGGSDLVNPSSSTTYTVTGTNTVTGCSDTAISSVIVNNLPTVTVNSGSICTGDSFTIMPGGANTYSYSGGSSVVSPSVDATYTISGTDANGCQNTAISSVTVNTLPSVSATSNNTLLCTGQTATLTANGAVSYTWSTNETTVDIIVNPTITTTYTVSGIDGNGCYNTYTISQDVDLCTGVIGSMVLENLKIYPNPNTGLFIVHITTGSEAFITNILGETVLAQALVKGMNSINIQDQPTGIYFVKISSNNQQSTIKIIKE